MRSWSYWLFGILSFIAVASGTAVWFSLKSLIADRVEKSLDGFKKGLKELDILKNQLGVLEKEHTVSILQDLAAAGSYRTNMTILNQLKHSVKKLFWRYLPMEDMTTQILIYNSDIKP